jgi:hypothetical protein
MGREEGNLITKKKTISMVAVVAIAAMLVSSVLTMYTAEAKSKTGKIKVEFISVGSHGKAKLKIINDETGKVIVKADLNFDKQLKSQGDNCCKKTYEFNWKGNHVGDELTLKVKTNDQGTFNSGGNLASGTTRLGIDLNGDDDD